jgi:hypothetical protein
MANYYVTDNGDNSTVTNASTGEIVFVGTYSQAASQAAELNRQSDRALYNQETTVTPSAIVTLNKSQGTDAQRLALMNEIDKGVDQNLNDLLGIQSSKTSPKAQITAGVGANDDNPQQSSSAAQSVSSSGSNSSTADSSGSSNTQNQQRIIPEPNVLDQFASSTWQASLYLMSSAQYSQFIQSKKKSLSGYNLLIQNSGAPVGKAGFVGGLQNQTFSENNGVTSSATAAAGRNPAFPLDFYIDNIVVKNYLLGKGSGIATNVSELTFQITEPNGITLINRLYQAVQDAAPRNSSGPIDYSQANYLMVIRWYGYDEYGNPQPPPATKRQTNNVNGSTVEKTDPRAIVEKYIPFQIADIDFTVSSRLVTYEVRSRPIGQMIGGTGRRGTIPADLELTGQTVRDVLQGNSASPSRVEPVQELFENDGTPSYTSGSGPASSAPSVGTLTAVGLTQAMNDLQKELVKNGTFQYGDTYEVVFAPGAEVIAGAKVTLKNPKANQASTPMSKPASQSPSSALPEKQSVAYSGRNIPVSAGTQMLYAIDQIIRNSSYIYDQANLTADESKPGEYIQNDTRVPVNWFNIMMEAVPDGNKYDTKRNATAYKIKYVITTYQVQNFVSRFFPTVNYLGVHKSYPYWFTGQNTAVLDYQAHINSMYQLVVTGSSPGQNLQNSQLQRFSASMADQIKWYYAPRSSESTAGAENRGNEIPAEAAEYMYGGSGLQSTKVKIIGDPAWIQQGSITGINGLTDSASQPFLLDGTINFDGVQPMFEVAFQKPEDYDLGTGLADPYRDKNNKSRLPKQSFIYQGTVVTSTFSGGRFEQQLEGTLYPFPIPDGSNAVSAPPGKQDPRRIDNPSGGLNSTTGQPLKAQPGVSNTNGALEAPVTVGEVSPGSSDNGDQDGVLPDDIVVAQSPPEPVDSEGVDVSVPDDLDFTPPSRLAINSDIPDTPQNMAIET